MQDTNLAAASTTADQPKFVDLVGDSQELSL